MESIVSAIEEFYTTADPQRRHLLDAKLTKFQREEKAASWQFALAVLTSGDGSEVVHFFAANCLYDRLNDDWNEYGTDEQNTNGIRDVLCTCVSASSTPPSTLDRKLTACLALFIMHCAPDVWETPVDDLISMWRNEHSSQLLSVLTQLPVQCSAMRGMLQQRNLSRSHIYKWSPTVSSLLTEYCNMEQPPVVEIIECVSEWLRLKGVQIDEWSTVISRIGQIGILPVIDGDSALEEKLEVINSTTTLLRYVLEHGQISCHRRIVVDVVSTLVTRVIPIIEHAVRNSYANLESIADLCTSFVQSIIAQSTYLIDNALDNEHLWSTVLALCSIEGRYPIDELVSATLTPLWHELAIDELNREHKFVTSLFEHVLRSTIVKCCLPSPTSITEEWDSMTVEQFDDFRASSSDTFAHCYDRLGDRAIEHIVGILQDDTTRHDAQLVESAVNALQSMAHYIQPNNATLELCFMNIIPSILNAHSSEVTVCASTCDLLGACSYCIDCSNRASVLMPVAIQCVLPMVSSTDSNVRTKALTALEQLTAYHSENIKDCASDIVSISHACFDSAACSSTDRLLALRCAGHAVHRLSHEHVRAHVTHVMSSTMTDLSISSLDEVLFALEVIGTLFKTFTPTPARGRRSDDEDEGEDVAVNDVQCVRPLMEQSVPLLEQLLNASPPATLERIREGVCTVLQNALRSLSPSDVALVMRPILELIGQMLTANHGAAFDVASQLIDIVGKRLRNTQGDQEFVIAKLAQWVTATRTALELPNGDGLPFVECSLQFMQHISRRHWSLIVDREHTVCEYLSLGFVCIECVTPPTITGKAAQLVALIIDQAYKNAHLDALSPWTSTSGGRFLELCYTQIVSSTVLMSTVEQLADALHAMLTAYPGDVHQVLLRQAEGNSFLALALQQMGNRRRFREHLKRCHMEAKRSQANS